MADLEELARRCEEASGPDRELDAAIAAAIRSHPYGADHWINATDLNFRPTSSGWLAAYRGEDSSQAWPSPAYTASLDAAMALVPEGMFRMVEGRPAHGYSADVGDVSDIIAATPALALTAAALRARLSLSQPLEDERG